MRVGHALLRPHCTPTPHRTMSSTKRPVGTSNCEPPAKRLASIFTPQVKGQPFTPLINNPLSFAAKVDGTTKLATWNVNGLQSAGSKEKGCACPSAGE